MTPIIVKKLPICSTIIFVLITVAMVLLSPLLVSGQTVDGLLIERLPSEEFANPGTPVSFETKITNFSASTLQNIVVVDRWPRGLFLDGVEGGEIEWVVPSLAPGQSESKVFNIVVSQEAPAGYYTLVTDVTVDQPRFERNLEYRYEVRNVQVLATEIIPEASGSLSRSDILGLALIVQLIVVAALSFNTARLQGGQYV